jgi:hypothetical protein
MPVVTLHPDTNGWHLVPLVREHVRFTSGREEYDVQLRERASGVELEVSSSHGVLSITPQASNVIRVGVQQ